MILLIEQNRMDYKKVLDWEKRVGDGGSKGSHGQETFRRSSVPDVAVLSAQPFWAVC